MRVSAEDCQHLDRSLTLEWLETNGRAGFASGTVCGPNTRRYHALLLVARKPPVERFVLVNHLEEWLEVAERNIPLSSTLYPGAVHPDGYRHCVAFATEPWPTWTYEVEGVRLQREIFCPKGRDIVVMRWQRLDTGALPVCLRVRPMLTGRDYHSLHHENVGLQTAADVKPGVVSWRPYRDLPNVKAFHSGDYRHAPDWYRRVQFPIERERGLDHEEDWWSPGDLSFPLETGSQAVIGFTTELVDSLDIADLATQEQRRRKQILRDAPKTDALARALWYATEAFLSERGPQQTVIAGYPWFTDWGRDTFISLPGICLITGRFDVAWQVIEAFAAHVSQGMAPNRFPDAGEWPEYNTVDASLWFVHAVGCLLTYTNDDERVRHMAWPAIQQILDGYRKGTRYGIRMDRDGLITSGTPGAQLTWMDAKIGDWVVTPRHGKPVEIQALWVRALAIGENLATGFGDPAYAVGCREDRKRAVESFRARFWYETGGYLYDVIDGETSQDISLRPNQIFAVSLTDELLSREQAKRVVRVVEEQLVTAVGLRTLTPGDPRYAPRYEGSAHERDAVYHQGTVWPFLLGPFVTAWIKTHGKTPALRRKARAFLDGLEQHLGEACLGHISEIFDGDPPHRPKGCVSQAWSVAEPLRALIEDVGIKVEKLSGGKPRSMTTTSPRERAIKGQPRAKKR